MDKASAVKTDALRLQFSVKPCLVPVLETCLYAHLFQNKLHSVHAQNGTVQRPLTLPSGDPLPANAQVNVNFANGSLMFSINAGEVVAADFRVPIPSAEYVPAICFNSINTPMEVVKLGPVAPMCHLEILLGSGF